MDKDHNFSKISLATVYIPNKNTLACLHIDAGQVGRDAVDCVVSGSRAVRHMQRKAQQKRQAAADPTPNEVVMRRVVDHFA